MHLLCDKGFVFDLASQAVCFSHTEGRKQCVVVVSVSAGQFSVVTVQFKQFTALSAVSDVHRSFRLPIYTYGKQYSFYFIWLQNGMLRGSLNVTVVFCCEV
jgi:hypothetical protein